MRTDRSGQTLMDWAPVHCKHCGRLLTNNKSEERGAGKICQLKHELEELKRQTENQTASGGR